MLRRKRRAKTEQKFKLCFSSYFQLLEDRPADKGNSFCCIAKFFAENLDIAQFLVIHRAIVGERPSAGDNAMYRNATSAVAGYG